MSADRDAAPPWTNVYGAARTILALGTLVMAFKDFDR